MGRGVDHGQAEAWSPGGAKSTCLAVTLRIHRARELRFFVISKIWIHVSSLKIGLGGSFLGQQQVSFFIGFASGETSTAHQLKIECAIHIRVNSFKHLQPQCNNLDSCFDDAACLLIRGLQHGCCDVHTVRYLKAHELPAPPFFPLT